MEQLAVAALWDVIATYSINRRRVKVAANLSMDTATSTWPPDQTPAAWRSRVVTGWAIEKVALARRVLHRTRQPRRTRRRHLRLTWPAARQRCSRAVRNLAAAVPAARFRHVQVPASRVVRFADV
ncbi:MAG TPA: hypothetical protein VIP77_19075, partial [Jiangellaceae bacterium]